MASEVKRGAPPKDGEWWDVKVGDTDTQLRWDGKQFVSPGGGWYAEHSILAHRKHEPLVVPKLKQMAKFRMSVACRNDNRSAVGIVFINDSYAFHCHRGNYATLQLNQITELTRAECEAAGYRWPLEDTHV